MLEFLSALFLWLTMITVSSCEPFDGLGSDLSSNIRLLDENPLEIFNRTLASKPTSTMRNEISNLRTPKTPMIPATSNKYPMQAMPSDNVDVPSHPPSRAFFTPPLPREHFHNPFADKPTLRGSNSDSSLSNRRPIPIPPPPPPPSVNVKPDKDRIPIKRPDLIAQSDSRKKTINTPSMQKLPEGLNYSEPSSSPSSSTTHRTNDTFDVVMPNVHNISRTSVLRILNNDKKYEFGNNKPRFEQAEQELKAPKTYKEELKNTHSSLAKSNTALSASSSSSSNSGSSSSSGSISVNGNSTSSTTYYKQNLSPSSFEDKDSGGERRKETTMISAAAAAAAAASASAANSDAELTEHQQITQVKSDFSPAVKSIQESTEVNWMGVGVGVGVGVGDQREPRARHILGIAWDIHVYLMAVLFAILAMVSAFSLFRMRAFKWLLPYGYFLAVHVLLMVIGAVRSVYLFYDAYNISRSFSEPISRLMLNVVFPFLVCIFSLMFVFILKIVDLKSDIYYARKSNLFMLLVVAYALCSVGIDLYADLTSYSSSLLLLSQCLYVFLCVILGVTYIIFYKHANRSSLRKQNSVYGTAFTDPLRPSLAHAIRVMLATSLLSLLMAAIQLIGIFCIYDPFNKDQPHPWLWWAFQLSVRVIEVSICFLVFWAAVQPLRGPDEKETHSHNSASAFPLFPWGATGGTPRGSDHGIGIGGGGGGGGGGGDDIYPTICSTNQAIHNYTLRTGKQVYEDIFQFCNAPVPTPTPAPTTPTIITQQHQHTVLTTPVPTHLLNHTTDRRSFNKHHHHHHHHHYQPPLPQQHQPQLDLDPVSTPPPLRSACGTLIMYPDRRAAAPPPPPPLTTPPSSSSSQQQQLQPSPSMLIDEKGIVRFRSIADAEMHADNTFSRLHRTHPTTNDNYSSTS